MTRTGPERAGRHADGDTAGLELVPPQAPRGGLRVHADDLGHPRPTGNWLAEHPPMHQLSADRRGRPELYALHTAEFADGALDHHAEQPPHLTWIGPAQ